MEISRLMPPLILKTVSRLQSRSFSVFLFFWLLFGATTSRDNLRRYNLQQMGVDAIVVHHTFAIGRSDLPILKPLGDVFAFHGVTLAAKQPGQFVWGAIPYSLLHMFGISYERDYDLAAALVTWLSAGLMAALALAALDRLLWQIWGFSRTAALVSVLTLGMASTWLPYAGIAHHDVEAAALITGALYAMERNRYLAGGADMRLVFASGMLLGLAVFTSMGPAVIVMVLGISGILTRSIRTICWRGAGFLTGLAPLLFYNGYYFGNIFVQANIAGNYTDTFFSLKKEQFLRHLTAYFGSGGLSIWKYAPGLTLGFIGLLLLPPALRRVKWMLGAAIVAHLIYVTNIPTLGICEYGPRYLLAIMPLLTPGVAALVDWRGLRTATAAKLFSGGALVAMGFLINLPGAIAGTMYCDARRFAFWDRVQNVSTLPRGNAPLSGVWLLAPAVIFFLCLLTRFQGGPVPVRGNAASGK